jgi:hypothetical protein
LALTDLSVCSATMALVLVRMLDMFVPFHVQGADSAPFASGAYDDPAKCPSDTCDPVIRVTPPAGVLQPTLAQSLKNPLTARPVFLGF